MVAIPGHLSCRIGVHCPYDIREDPKNMEAMKEYLNQLAEWVQMGEVRHISISVHYGSDGYAKVMPGSRKVGPSVS